MATIVKLIPIATILLDLVSIATTVNVRDV